MRDTHWIDVRAPIEFSSGSIPGAINLPLLTDEERHRIGITYKEQGQAAAVALGHELVSGNIRNTRIEAWSAEVERHPDAIIYCFRGGLRSQIVQSWLQERGIDRPIVEGGYKALRRFLLDALEAAAEMDFQVVCGATGSGKTDYLRASGKPHIDLEACAAHRGSAFGAYPYPQPSQADFENILARQLLRVQGKSGPVLVEDESRMIGRRTIPETLFRRLQISPRIVLEVPLERRVDRILRDYVENSSLGESGDLTRFDDFRSAVRAISRKLGGLRTQELLSDLDAAQAAFTAGQGFGTNREWIRKLLVWYYDPHYNRGTLKTS
ncbi:MAG: tRNA 2-selenouridine(34) synthase MnmH [Bdellovibrionales bacterium]|nr:tRNA 2-selenouridine(34) synthase MnmH [Bdellovibrionales bacterium]